MLRTTATESEKSSTPLLPDATQADPELLNRLAGVSDRQVDSAARKISPYSEDDDANDKRWVGAENRRTFYKIRRWLFWFLFGLICLVATICSFGYLFLVWLWVGNLVWGTPLKNPAGLQNLITSVLWTILVVFATLFGESVFKDRER